MQPCPASSPRPPRRALHRGLSLLAALVLLGTGGCKVVLGAADADPALPGAPQRVAGAPQ